MSCPYRFDVAVYALGALDPAEREAFERHLPGCDACTRALAEVAGLPGLLAHAPQPGSVTGNPDTTGATEATEGADAAGARPALDGVLRRVRRRRRVGRLLAACGVVVGLLGGLGVAAVSGRSTDAPVAAAPGAAPVAREIVLPSTPGSQSSGSAGLTTRPWGSQVVLACVYHGAPRPAPPADAPRTIYLLVVRGPDGGEQQIARWSPPPGQDVVVTAATDLLPDRIAGLEVRTADGDVVMRS
jgi:Putative zinc-finger